MGEQGTGGFPKKKTPGGGQECYTSGKDLNGRGNTAGGEHTKGD